LSVPTELIANLPNRPGVLADAAGAIGRENVNIRAFAAVLAGKAEKALKKAGYKVRRVEVIALPASDTPGELAAYAENLAKAGINIEGGFLASAPDGKHTEIIFEVGDVKAARKALER
jgi:hypothetical protein